MPKTSLITLIKYSISALLLGIGAYLVTVHFITLKELTAQQGTEIQNYQPESETPNHSETTSVGTDTFTNSQTSSAASNQIATDVPIEQIAVEEITVDSGQRAMITLAGGCFWCTEAYLQETSGVVSAVSGYTGGASDTATYQKVSSGNTRHREAVQVVYDPVRISLADILEVYWTHIDPTDAGGQFADRGHQYSTAIYYHSPAQKLIVETSKQALERSGLFDQRIETEVLPYSNFYEAEEYHQDYYLKASAHYEQYKKASGRTGFIDNNWAKEAALQFFDTQEVEAAASEGEVDVYREKSWSDADIQVGLSKLSAEAYRVVVHEGTEPKNTNEFNDFYDEGIYVDVVTGDPLFSSTHKYEAGSGWPAFWQTIGGENIILKSDFKLIVPRIEVRSVSGHLGHVFNDGPVEYGGKRYCINSVAMNFVPRAEMAERGYSEFLYLFE